MNLDEMKTSYFLFDPKLFGRIFAFVDFGNVRHDNSVFRIDKARKNGFKVITKETKMIPQYDENGKFVGKFPKCNFDVEITMDILMSLENYDTVMLFSADSDFGGLL